MDEVKAQLADVGGDLLHLDGTGHVLACQTGELWTHEVGDVVDHLVPAAGGDWNHVLKKY